MRSGRFVVLEGIDGAGTTTQSRRLQHWLEAKGLRVHPTREPSDGPIGTLLRAMLTGRVRESQAAGGGPVGNQSIALLFAADRLDHVSSEIRPALAQGFWVLSDRYVTSSIAYQGTLVGLEWTRLLNQFAPFPDLTILLHLPASIAMQRLHAGRTAEELYEKQELLESVSQAYLTEARSQPDRFFIIDGDQTPEAVQAQICAELSRRFPELS